MPAQLGGWELAGNYIILQGVGDVGPGSNAKKTGSDCQTKYGTHPVPIVLSLFLCLWIAQICLQ
jgi:hypothetical protein